MSQTENETAGREPAKIEPKPEEMGHPVPGTGEAIEPEALHDISDAAVRTGDRMWGPPGPPEDRS